MFTAICKRIGVWVVQKDRLYLLIGVLCLLGSVTLTANAILTVSNSGMFGDADVTVDSAGTLNVGTASSTAVVIGKTGTPVTIPGNVAINGALTLGSASTTGQLLFYIASSSFTTLLQASSSQASNLTFTLPTTAGTAGQAMLTDGAGNLFFGNPGSSQWLNGTSGTIFYSSGNIGINTTTPLALLSIVGSSTSPTSLFNVATSTGASLFNIASNGNVTVGNTVLTSNQPIDLLCSGDITTAFAAAVTQLLGAAGAGPGGTIRLSSGDCTVTSLPTLPNTGGSAPTQPPLRITGQGASANGYWTGLPAGGTRLNLTQNATVAKIDTRGAGLLEIDHITLMDGGSDCSAFIQTTNTTLHIHDNAFSGTASGSSACNDAMILGGTSTTIGGSSIAPFQGYGTVIEDNFFDKIKRGVYGQAFANAVVVRDNTWSGTCGGVAAVEFAGASSNGNYGGIIVGNLFEISNYNYAAKLAYTDRFTFSDNNIYDSTGTTIAVYRFESTANHNQVVMGSNDGTTPPLFSDAGSYNSQISSVAGIHHLNFQQSSSNTTLLGDGAQEAFQIYNVDPTVNNWSSINFSQSAYGNTAATIAVQNVDRTSNYGSLFFGTRSASGYSWKVQVPSDGGLRWNSITPPSCNSTHEGGVYFNDPFTTGMGSTMQQCAADGLGHTYMRSLMPYAQQGDPGCTTVGQVGAQWFDTTSTTTVYRVCMNVAGTVGWVIK